MTTDPDFYNQMVVNKLGNVMKDRVNVRKFRTVLDKHSMDGTPSKFSKAMSKNAKKNPLLKNKLKIDTDPATFDKMITNINNCSSVANLKQYKYFISLQINKALKELGKRNEQDDDEEDSALRVYSKRLQVLKSMADARLLSIIPIKGGSASPTDLYDPVTIPPSLNLDMTLNRVLHDSNSLYFFSQFMEQRQRTPLLQFWLTVNGIRNPLQDLYIKETSDSDDDDDTDEFLNCDLSQVEDVRNIYEQFFNNKLLRIDSKIYTAVASFADTKPDDPVLYGRARKAILRLQKQVLERMQKTDFVAFKQSHFFLNLLASEKQNRLMKQESKEVHADDTEDEINGDPLANYQEDDSGDENDQKVSDTVLKAVEDALNEIMNDKLIDRSTSQTGLSGLDDLLLNHSSSNTPRNSRLISKEMQKDLFGAMDSNGAGLFDESPDHVESDKAEGKLFDDEDSSTIIDDDQSFMNGSESISSLMNASQELKMAAPGDLNLGDEIEKLSEDIERLDQQLIIIEPLITKAELTNNVAELKILNKSKIGLKRELQLKELQKQQYIVQENDNSLYGKSKVRIQSYINGNEDHKDIILYIIEVQKLSSENSDIVTAGWMVARRFSQFFKLNLYLKAKYPRTADLDFPKRKMVMKFQQTSLVVERQHKLETYLQQLIQLKEVCADRLFRDFLSSEVFSIELNESFQNVKPSTTKNAVDVATRLYNSISDQLLYAPLAANIAPILMPNQHSASPSKQSDGAKDKPDGSSLEMQKELSSLDDDLSNTPSKP
ncbi:hypothetical protein CANARDRAFT_179140, partial [[Candida] arabinofermentans NRRL YB-2248]